MTITTKFDMGQTLIVPLDTVLFKGKVVSVYVRLHSTEQEVEYLVSVHWEGDVTTKDGPRKITDERDVFITEERAMRILQLYKGIKQKDPAGKEGSILASVKHALYKLETSNADVTKK